MVMTSEHKTENNNKKKNNKINEHKHTKLTDKKVHTTT